MWKILKQQTKYMPNLSKGKEDIPRTRIGFYHFAMTFTFAFHLVTTRLLLKNLFIWNTSHIRLSREYTSICLKGIFFFIKIDITLTLNFIEGHCTSIYQNQSALDKDFLYTCAMTCTLDLVQGSRSLHTFFPNALCGWSMSQIGRRGELVCFGLQISKVR